MALYQYESQRPLLEDYERRKSVEWPAVVKGQTPPVITADLTLEQAYVNPPSWVKYLIVRGQTPPVITAGLTVEQAYVNPPSWVKWLVTKPPVSPVITPALTVQQAYTDVPSVFQQALVSGSRLRLFTVSLTQQQAYVDPPSYFWDSLVGPPKPITPALSVQQAYLDPPSAFYASVAKPPVVALIRPALMLAAQFYDEKLSWLVQSAVTTLTPTPTPTPPAGGGQSGADSQWSRDWRWYEDQELRPNWYEYPEVKKLKADIVKVAKKKKAIERKLSFAKGPDDMQAMMASLNGLQEKLAAMMESYRAALNIWQAAKLRNDEEEAEFMEMLSEIL